ncbi:HAMP domain-containing sensor histidine kinase [Cohnella sp. AR92]|uniref:HAMP domain-containing sensor histidine kinase n=1 Tax=Cohnella sp. AR92 TaxID=648716 RepID=UPI000F8EF124|nr:HAMP domain-containing sensor histidine kinase [Cohnella sp. AR92]RUS48881.1 HAMP domain-containing histidine kinase [Cohnella sp. AR92]
MRARTFLVTLTLFLLFFNLSIFLFSAITLKTNLDGSRERSLGEHYFIASTYGKDLYALESRGTIADAALGSLFQSYSAYYGKQGVALELSEEGRILYTSLPKGDRRSGHSQAAIPGERTVTTTKLDGRTYVSVIGNLPAPYETYTLTYLYDVSGYLSAWSRMTGMLFLLGIVLCTLLAVCLHFVLGRVFKPLRQISEASKCIAQGEYGNRIGATRHDELSEMADSFNHMAEEIQKQIGQLKLAAEQKQRFIDNFAHELRTPLTSIYGYAEYIQKVELTDEDKLAATDYIMSESRRLQNLAYQLLELATLGRSDIRREPVEIKELFRKTEETLKLKLEDCKVRLTWKCRLDAVDGDRDLLESLVVNLADNAVKACPPGGLVLLEAYMESERPVILVTDDGKGMTDEQLGRVTEAFYRVDQARSRAGGGAGLGLALCEQIAASHGAKLSFSSQIGRGTISKITFTTS